MDELRSIDPEIILLYATRESTELFLQQTSLNLSSHGNNLVLTMNFPYIKTQVFEKMENNLKKIYNNTNKGLLALADDSVQVLKQALNEQPCSSIDGKAVTMNDTAKILACIRKVDMCGRTGKVKFDEKGTRKEINLEILNLQNNYFRGIGTWNSTTGVTMFGNILRNSIPSSTAETLEGKKLRAVIVENEPFVMKKQDGDNVWYEGYSIDLFKELAKILKFAYEFYPTPDGYYGAKTENGTWNGLVGELIGKRADVIVASLTVTERRAKVVDFSVPFMFYTNDILMKKSSKEDHDLLQFMSPFHNSVWFCTLGALVLISVAVFAINYYSPYGYKDESGRRTSDEFSYFNSLWFAVACMLQQGGDNTPRSLSGRILTGCYWFCILIWVSTYTANLAAFFTVKNAERPINNLKDLANSNYEIGVIHSGATYQAFKESQYETHKTIWHRMEAANTFLPSIAEGVQWVREREKFAFISEGLTLRHAAKKPPCNLKTVPGLSSTSGLAFALQANDPHTREFTLAILRLQRIHVLEDLYRKWWQTSNSCVDEENTLLAQKQIDLKSMLGVYIVLLGGIVFAFITLIAEMYWERRIRRRVLNTFRRCRTKISAETNS
ncbi:glutamate receptor ionotropic, kainate 5-like [Porites lutea]|uniref:glutamate receptor ionotropic, kainate 5-like n=1 Tax=Porites lutea TaxID=51062 RepID=UPI003CC66E3A